MRTLSTLITLGSITGLTSLIGFQPASAREAPVIDIQNFVGTLKLTTVENGAVQVSGDRNVSVSHSGDVWKIDGKQNMRKVHCRIRRGHAKISIGRRPLFKKNYKGLDSYPHLRISAPADVVLKIKKAAVFGNIGSLAAADIDLEKCANLSFRQIESSASFEMSGASTVSLETAGTVTLETAGASEFTVNKVGGFQADLSGASELDIRNATGDVNIEASGASDIQIGHVSGDLDMETSGATDVAVDYVGGRRLDLSLSGSSDIVVADGDVDQLVIESSGTSDVSYDGHSRDANLDASGIGDINIRRPSGHLYKEKSGITDITIHD